MKIIACFLLTITVHTISAQNLKVMTYNIRLDYSADGKNEWSDRKEKLLSQVQFFEPDIMGIQEGLPHQVAYLDTGLSQYKYIGVGRDDGKSKGEFSAIYYKSSLELLQSGTFWLSPTPEKPSKGWDAALPRICTYGLFETSSGHAYWVFNTHFDHRGEQARVESMKVILSKIEELNTENFPVIVMGDLNVTPDEAPILEMKQQLSDTRDIAKVVYGPDATFNAFQFDETPTRRIDYIAVSNQIIVEKYAVLTGSFEQKYISDHFPVYCEIGVK
ncbi:endonuclease/exonuclease/phosphatase family protein [Marinoscillum furvescens]|uniref:Endonuclease/exonuclease/phosphatase family metal-dependent hydrolase n=1 Tax=Marinoscillum furvescens DSM 4134 TaxID=1122208 RepID=A0A3D9L6G9_MARFU|nr:endonuclease/exonuclease/phosphatase family protein [Marinoscillum furvescens]REE00558.1 endonuclease/exonuclease/phosphatase family metal-dependent hydrolase [Marinoscillum furvescens DSM 4134]